MIDVSQPEKMRPSPATGLRARAGHPETSRRRASTGVDGHGNVPLRDYSFKRQRLWSSPLPSGRGSVLTPAS